MTIWATQTLVPEFSRDDVHPDATLNLNPDGTFFPGPADSSYLPALLVSKEDRRMRFSTLSPSGQYYSTCGDWAVVSETSTQRSLRSWFGGDYFHAAFSRLDSLCAVGTSDGTALVVPIGLPVGAADLVKEADFARDCTIIAEAVAGRRYSDKGTIEALDPHDWNVAIQNLRTLASQRDKTSGLFAWWLLFRGGERPLFPGGRAPVAALVDDALSHGQLEPVKAASLMMPQHPLAHISLAKWEADPGDGKSAMGPKLRRADFYRAYGLARLPADAAICLQAARMLRAQKDYARASAAARRCLEVEPANVEGHRELFLALKNLEDWFAASAVGRKLIALPNAEARDFTDIAFFASQRAASSDLSQVALQRGRERFPEKESIHRMAGWSYLNLKDPAAALSAFQEAEKRPSPATVPDLLAGLVSARWLNGDKPGALADFERLVAQGRSAKPPVDWELVASFQGAFTKSEQKPLLEALAENLRNTSSTAGLRQLALAITALGQVEEPIALWKQIAPRDEATDEDITNYATLLFKRQEYAAADAVLDSWLQHQPEGRSSHAHYLKGRCLLEQSKMPEALQEFEAAKDALQGDEASADLLAGLTITYLRTGNQEAAEDRCRRLLRTSPDWADYETVVAEGWGHYGNTALAETLLVALRAEYTGIELERRQAKALHALNRMAEEQALRDRIVQSDQANADDYVECIYLHGKLGHETETRRLYERARTLFSPRKLISTYFGLALINLKKAGEAHAVLERGQDEPGTESEENLRQSGLVITHWLAGRYAESCNLLTQLITKSPQWADPAFYKPSDWPAAERQPILAALAETLRLHPELKPK